MNDKFWNKSVLDKEIKETTNQLKELNRLSAEKKDIYETVATARRELSPDVVKVSKKTHQIDEQIEQVEKVIKRLQGEILQLSEKLIYLLGKNQRLEESLILLSEREQKLYQMMTEGRTSSYMAKELSMTEGSVKNLKKTVVEKVSQSMEAYDTII